MNYNITVYINDGTEIILPVTYDKEYDLRRDITNLGISGVLNKDEESKSYLFYPSHRIDRIEIKEIKS